MTDIPLFALPPTSHRTYVRLVRAPEFMDGYLYECLCRACEYHSPWPRVLITVAAADGVLHRAAIERLDTIWGDKR